MRKLIARIDPAKYGTSTRYSLKIPGKSGQALVIPRKYPARSAGKFFHVFVSRGESGKSGKSYNLLYKIEGSQNRAFLHRQMKGLCNWFVLYLLVLFVLKYKKTVHMGLTIKRVFL